MDMITTLYKIEEVFLIAYQFVTEAPWYCAYRTVASIPGPAPFLCHPEQRIPPCIVQSSGGEETNAWKDVTRRKNEASDTELWFCPGCNRQKILKYIRPDTLMIR